LKGFVRALLQIYGAIAILLLVVAAIEARLGMFTNLTLAESVLDATGTDLPPVEQEAIRVALIPSP